MNEQELGKRAEELVKEKNELSIKGVHAGKTYRDFLGGVLVDVTFQDKNGKESINHVYFPENNGEPIVKITFSEVCEIVSRHREQSLFFRFLEFAGIGGLIALVLTGIFAILLFILAVWIHAVDPAILEIIKMSFTLILGYFFGSQARKSE